MDIRGAVAVAGVLMMSACTELPESPPAVTPVTLPTVSQAEVFPGADWLRAPRRGFADLDRTLESTGSTCVAVVRDGELVHEAYWGGGSPEAKRATYSITKSLTAILVGIAADDGDLALDDAVADHVPSWRGTASRDVTIRDVLANTSGRHTDDATDDRLISQSADASAFAVDLGQDAAPGDTWEYNNSAIQVLETVLEKATGQEVVDFATKRLLEPLDMRHTTWARDRAGNATTYSGVYSSCPDLARVGLLMMRGGDWDGRRIVSQELVAEATGRPSSRLNAAYGLLWWVNGEGRVVEVLRQAGYSQDKPSYDGRIAPGVPADAFWAYGYGDEYVAVVPSEGVVAVRLGGRPETPDQLSFDVFTGGVLDALDPG